jgi:CheY-like chemotaxis protein
MKVNAVILIAEDDEGHFTLMCRNLHRNGLANEIIRFRDGCELLDYLQRLKQEEELYSRPHLLFLDIRMPKVDGLDALAKIKSDPSLRRMPVIIITTASDVSIIEQCHQLGCCMYLVKPVEYDKFVQMMQKVGNFLSIMELPSLVMNR